MPLLLPCRRIALAVLACLSACADPVVLCPPGFLVIGTGCHCPVGQHPETSTNPPSCVADEVAVDAKPGPDAKVDAGASDAIADTPVEPDATVADTGADAKPDVKPDIKPDVPVGGKNAIGAACTDDFDCLAGLACFNWPKGYCTLTNCDAPGQTCPGNAACWGETKFSQICTQGCEEAADCRTADGYACKRLSQEFGALDARLCLPGGKQPPGLGCTKPLECAGASTCLTDMPGGYCARLGCGLGDACEAGTACVLRNGKPMCLKTCKADVECQIPTKQTRKCVDKTDLGKKAVKVCLDSATSAPVGSPCVADLDCDSKLCTVFAKGNCAVGGQPCLNDGGCGAAAPCNLDPAAEKGVCSAPCSTDKACPTGGVCVPGAGDGFSGTCQPACKGPGDDDSCGGVPGLTCVYGQPLPPPNGSALATYACGPQPKASPGSNCNGDAECSAKKCFQNAQKTAGFCAGKCPGGSGCPYGTVCADTGISWCLKMCSGDYDCPPQMKCEMSSAAGTKVCMQP